MLMLLLLLVKLLLLLTLSLFDELEDGGRRLVIVCEISKVASLQDPKYGICP